MGNKIYQAALQAGITLIPAIIKTIDDDLINEYKIISNISQDDDLSNNVKNFNSEPPSANNTINLNTEIKSDIINLSDLNKQEYEREDVKMNNELNNNNTMNNNLGANVNNNMNGEPTFGGKFFPSLEDEPTNMNMGGVAPQPQPNPTMPEPTNPLEQNNLIDLTDNGVDNSIQSTPNNENFASQDFNNAEPVAQTPGMTPTSTPMDNQINVPNNTPEPTVPNNNIGNTISLDNLTSQYAASAPQAPTINNPLEQNMTPTSTEETLPQFDMSQSIDPNPMMSPDINLGANSYAVDPIQDPNQVNPNMDMTIPNYTEPVSNNNSQVQDYNTVQPTIPEQQMEPVADSPIQTPNDINMASVKDTAPVLNTIKTLATNLAAFGYTINITDEDSTTFTKITIEIQK